MVGATTSVTNTRSRSCDTPGAWAGALLAVSLSIGGTSNRDPLELSSSKTAAVNCD
jgi:hypothetical protein